MTRPTRWRPAFLTLACLLVGLPACGEEPKGSAAESAEAAPSAAGSSARNAEKAEALSILKRSSDFLSKQTKFSFEAELGFDAVQSTGQKLEFGGSRKVTVRRPDRARIEALRRHGEEQTLFFDGEQISVSFPDENAYASVKKPGTLDEALDYLIDDLGIPAPLADFLYSDFYSEAAGRIESGFAVGDVTIDGLPCQHVAFRGQEVDFQIWIEKGDRPLPARLVITHPQAEGSPQFWARFHDWNLSPKAPDRLFQFTPPEGAERLPFAPRDVSELQSAEVR